MSRSYTDCLLLVKAVILVSLVVACEGQLAAQPASDAASPLAPLEWSTDSPGPRRFVSVHGRRAAIFGYSQDGLEVWAYPVQILSSLLITFRPQGATTGIDGQAILRRIVYSPEAVTRIYAGPNFVVREKLFVPLDEPGAIITFEVDGSRPVDITVRFIPVLNLMWPASVGGQEAIWNPAASAYLLLEPTHQFTARIGSPDIVAHDDTPNSAQHVGNAPGLAFTIRAGGDRKAARVIIAGSGPGQDLSTLAKRLLEDGEALEKSAVAHYADLVGHAVQIETPDAEVNRALAWSQIALDQAWVCSPELGCGSVAGYGPSRKARRPQYDWFFAGDGMVAVNGLLAENQYEHARQELEFILRHQDQKTGMIWHELSQSAPWLDWDKYPFLYMHVDLTFQFLNTVGEYVSTTGDRDFLKAHWPAIQAAYGYCRSLVDSGDGLPHIPAEKRGEREQDALSDELTLSASWAEASQAYAELASEMHDEAAAQQARAESLRASRIIGQRYWDERQQFWISGYTRAGMPLMDRNIGPAGIMGKLFSEAQRNTVMDQLASSDFQADWGTRGNASSASTYQPDSYASGSVWAIGTAGVAGAFWTEHRPATAWPIWSALIPWTALDSLGHIHEALAGDYYHEEIESVPEQTWSSTAFLTTTVNGLLGLQVEGASNRLVFTPHLPPKWDTITLRNLKIGPSRLALTMTQSASEIRLQVQNDGAPVNFDFDPEIPLGAELVKARLDNRLIAATLEQHPQDSPRQSRILSASRKYVSGDWLFWWRYANVRPTRDHDW